MVTNLMIRMPSCLSFKGKYYYEGGSRVYAGAPMNAFMNVADSKPQSKLSPLVSVRTFFPETWLFELFETG